MAKRLHMTSADYVAIAVSPALIMALIGSVVFFLIEVLYVGDYTARLVYVFALFVFATVLIARLAIEFGGEHASLFALPLGVLTFLVLVKFVEHPSPFSHLINLALMAVIWWWAHKLTVNCTLIDDNEDASGEGLMQRMGIDDPISHGELASTGGSAPLQENELLSDPSNPTKSLPWWKRWFQAKPQAQPPGLWVLYFSLVALPLFGLGQHWIPPNELGRRRYAFALLAVYVAAALALLVTTSFLGLRRYLRQRRLEMPAPMAATWVGVGVCVILMVMVLAALIPRPAAEYAISQVPWRAGSPDGLKSSRFSVGRDGVQEQDKTGQATSDEGPQGNQSQEGAKGDPAKSDRGHSSKSADGKQTEDAASQQSSNQSAKGEGNKSADDSQSKDNSKTADGSKSADDPNRQSPDAESRNDPSRSEQQPADRPSNVAPPNHPPLESLSQAPQAVSTAVSSLAGVLKLVLYAAIAIVIALLAWRHRQQIAQAIADILKQLRDLLARLFGGRSAAAANTDSPSKAAQKRERSFSEFRDPFASGDHRRVPPQELVRYTFEAFEAWARDGGCPRSPDQTPAELVRAAVPPKTEMSEEARRMLRLYSEVAYASGGVSREAATSLRALWTLMCASPRSHAERMA
jgi:hypothetical protein